MVFPVRLVLFFREKSFPDFRIPPEALAAAPVSVLTELIVISFTPELVAVVILVAPEAINLKSPNANDSELAATLVTSFVSVESTVIVDPV